MTQHLYSAIPTNINSPTVTTTVITYTNRRVYSFVPLEPDSVMDQYVSNATSIVPHPFYPLEAKIVGYLANEWSVPTLLGLFAAGWVAILGVTLLLVRQHNPDLPSREKATILWFVLSVCSLQF